MLNFNIKEVQFKTTLRFHFMPVIMIVIMETKNAGISMNKKDSCRPLVKMQTRIITMQFRLEDLQKN